MRKYVGSFKSIQNVTYRIELWDDPSGTTPEITARLYAARVLAAGGYQEGSSCLLTKLQSLNSSTELKLAGNGFSIERQGEGDSVYENFVRSSRATSQWVMPDQTTLDDFIAIQTMAETAWAMIIYRNDVMWYVGRVLADQMTRLRESIESKPIIELVAVDGLELMDGFKVKSAWFTDGKITISQLIRRCLESFDLWEYWGINGTQTEYIYEGVLLRESHASRLGLDMYKVDEYTLLQSFDPFSDVKVVDAVGWLVEPNYLSCKQALENVLLMFGARLIHELGAYYVIPPTAYNSATTINLRRYSYTAQYQGTTTYTHRQTIGNDVRPLWMAKPSLYYQPAAQSVTVNTKRQNLAKQLRNYTNRASSMLELRVYDVPQGSTPDDAPMRIRLMAKSQKRSIIDAGVTYVEDCTDLYYKIRLLDGLGGVKVLDANGYWVNGTPTNKQYRMPTNNIKGGWITSEFELTCTTAPIGYKELRVELEVHGVVLPYSSTGKWKNGNSANKDFWGSIQVSFADASAYKNADYTFDISEITTAATANLVNSSPVVLEPVYYTDALPYGLGNWLVNNGTTDVLASDWYGGWDSITHGTITKMLGLQMASVYADFLPVIRGNWIDSGTLTSIKSLYFDNYAWVLNGVRFDARSEQWDGEWLAISPVYTNSTSSGEGLRVNQSPTGNLGDRLNYTETAIANLNGSISDVPNQVLEHLVNYADQAPTTQPTQTTQWEVMLKYTDSTDSVTWLVQEHGTFKTYTAGVHSLDTAFEGHLLDAAIGSITINLPSVAEQKGKRYYFVKLGSAHGARIDAYAGQTINGSDHLDINTNYASKTIICDGSAWYIIATAP